MDGLEEEEFAFPLSQQNGHTQLGTRKTSKIFNDPIHKHFKLRPATVAFMDTPHFQRLRWLKQLGLTYQIFPGASHNRFEHSIGVAHLGGSWARYLKDSQQEESNSRRAASQGTARRLDIEEKGEEAKDKEGITLHDITLVEIAGLCHDLGHGPFSHVFEHEVLPRIMNLPAGHDNMPWCHEQMSLKILDDLVDNYIDLNLYEMDKADISLIKDYMTGQRGQRTEKLFLFDIVANKRNSIDVDKFDYLQRDAMCSGVMTSCDFGRLMTYSQVIDDEICFKWSEYENVHTLFSDRARMHSKVYTHRKAKSVEFMVIDALHAAEPVLNIKGKINEVRSFLKLDDSILRTIEQLEPEESEHSGAIREAQSILERLYRRDLYAFCAEVAVPKEMVGQLKLPSAQDILAHQEHNSNVLLHPEQIIVSENKINFAMKDKNPLELTHFYYTEGNKERIPQKRVSAMMPDTFQDVKFRVYSKSRDRGTVEAVNTAFRCWVKKHLPKDALDTSGRGSPDLEEHMTPLPGKKRQRTH